MKMAEVKLTGENFMAEVIESEVPVLVDFYADWCGPCKMLAPVVAQLAEEYAGKAKIAKANVDEQMELASKFRVVSIPTILLFDKGQVVKQFVGFTAKNQLAAELDKLV
jgi:thioredoxin 1